MSNLPVSKLSSEQPVNGVANTRTSLGRVQARDVAESISIMTGFDQEEVETGLISGQPGVQRKAKQEVAPSAEAAFSTIIETAYAGSMSIDEAARAVSNERQKQAGWSAVGDLFFLEQAASLGDPNVDSQMVNFATNLTTGQNILQQEIEKEADDAGILLPLRYFGDFVDRYIFRAVPIGGIEAVTNRPERLGTELLAKAITLDPVAYETYIRGKVDEWRNEGIIVGDNIFALMDAAYAMETRGEDPYEFINRTFGVLDIAAVAPAAKLITKAPAIVRAATPIQRLAAVRGPEVATDAAAALAKRGNGRALTDLQPSAIDPRPDAWVRPSSGRLQRIVDDNQLVNGIGEYIRKGSLGRSVQSPEVARVAEDLLGQMGRVASNPVANVGKAVKTDLTGNFVLDVSIGTQRGAPFKRASSANKLVSRLKEGDFPTAKVVAADPTDETKGFYVNVTQRFDPGKGVEALDYQPFYGPVRQVIARAFGSKAATEATLLNDLAGMAEGAASVVGRMAKPQIKLLNQLNTESKTALSRLFADLRDGPDAFVRDGYTHAEFVGKWKTMTGRLPTEKEVNGFNALRDINDTAYILAADRKLKQYVSRDYWGAVIPGQDRRIPVRGVAVDDLPAGALVVDPTTGALIAKADLPKKQKVWVSDEDIEGNNFWTKVDIKPLDHTDVLGYNAGGRRINPDANFFVVSGDTNPRAFLTAFSESQAQRAVNDIEEIRKAVADNGGIDAVAGSNKLDDVIAKHNDWNPSIETTEDFLEFAKAKGIRLDTPVTFKVRDGQVKTGEVTFGFPNTWGEHYLHTMRRYDDVLTEYGGKEARQRDPISAMFEDYSSQTMQFTHNVQTHTALHSWVKAAARKGSGWEVPETSDIRRAFEEAKMVDGVSPSAGHLNQQRSIIESRLNIKSDLGKRMEWIGAQMQAAVFDKTTLKVPRNPLEKAQQGLLNLGFQSAFGFFNTSQFVVQGFHAATIAAIAPRHGLRGIAMAPALQMALLADDLAQESMALQRLAKFSGLSVDDMNELAEYVRQSGRNIIDSAVIEKGTAQSWGVSGWKGETFLPNAVADAKATSTRAAGLALQGGLTFFREGERMSRLTGIITSFLEFKAKNPGVSALSDLGRRTIGRREQALSFRMTNTNRAVVQDGIGKLPTQWFSYTLRAMENVALGRDFSAGERVRMAAFLGPFFGLTGLGLERGADYIAEKLGAEPAGTVHTAIKYGIWDTLFEVTTGQELALSERLAPLTLVFDVYDDIVRGNKTPLQAAMGPSGDISFGFMDQIGGVLNNLFAGHSVSMSEDAIRTIRQISGVDNVFKAMGVVRNGIYRSRTGTTLPFELDNPDAVGLLLGFSPREVNEWYQNNTWRYRESRQLKDFTNDVETDWHRAVEMYNNGNVERGLQLMQEIDLKIMASGFSQHDMQTVRRSLKVTASRDLWRIIQDEYRRERPYRAKVLEETFNFPGEAN